MPTFDLDALEREGATEPFTVTVADHELVFLDPQDMDWQMLMKAMVDPMVFFSLCLGPDDSKMFLKQPIPVWKMTRLMEAYMRHYGLPTPPEAAASS